METLLDDIKNTLNSFSSDILEVVDKISKREDENFILISYEKFTLKISKKSEERILYCGVIKLFENKNLEIIIKHFLTTILMEKLDKNLKS